MFSALSNHRHLCHRVIHVRRVAPLFEYFYYNMSVRYVEVGGGWWIWIVTRIESEMRSYRAGLSALAELPVSLFSVQGRREGNSHAETL